MRNEMGRSLYRTPTLWRQKYNPRLIIYTHMLHWNEDSATSATGGGISDYFPVPDYQIPTGIPTSANPGELSPGPICDPAGLDDLRKIHRLLLACAQKCA